MYIAVATIVANLAVLKTAFFPVYASEIALGTGVFTSIFLCNDIINEYYGKKSALKAVAVGFFAYLLFLLLIFIIAAYSPALDSLTSHNALLLLLSPAPAIFIASIVAYLCSQYLDLIIYRALKIMTKSRFIFFRSFVSTAIGSFFDNVIFSLLAWYVLAPDPMPLSKIWITYIWGIYLMRLVLSLLNAAYMPIINRLRPKIYDQ
jgi:uncharacterized integral membrane protein (TIGR00697 family)